MRVHFSSLGSSSTLNPSDVLICSGVMCSTSNGPARPVAITTKREPIFRRCGGMQCVGISQYISPPARPTPPPNSARTFEYPAGRCISSLTVHLVSWGMKASYTAQRSDRVIPYFRREPISTSSRKAARTGRPSGPTEAAMIMPLDSTPRSLRGARLTTTATLRPMRDPGS
jgi:hypothetical protein